MDFLYRLPLIDFNPNNEIEIQSHWHDILQKIKYSSPVLYNQIKNQDYRHLSESLKNSVYKYLLRGKYRATPFGKWSAVGLGNWAEQTQSDIAVKVEEIANLQKNFLGSTPQFVLAPGFQKCHNIYLYFSFDQTDQKWVQTLIEPNKLIHQIIHHFKTNRKISFPIFSSWFSDVEEKTQLHFWNKILETQLLQPSISPYEHSSKKGINLKSTFQIELSQKIKRQLDLFTLEMGNYIIKQKRPILDHFIKRFPIHYDDRYVSLNELLKNTNFLNQCLTANFPEKIKERKQQSTLNLFPGVAELNLTENQNPGALPPEISDVQYLFHLTENEDIVLENIVINRPFVYSGRFTEDPAIFNYSKSKKPSPSKNEHFIYCDILVRESQTIQFLTKHRNCFDYHIDLLNFSNPSSIPLEEIYIGIDSGRIILVWRKKNKIIIPIFQHPLNGSQITFPLFRLLWEISHQDSFKFLVYALDSSQHSHYYPRYRWNNIILQERQWKIFKEQFPTMEGLKTFLKENQIPQFIQVGLMDQSIHLNWKNSRDFKIFYQELQKKSNLNILEISSNNSSPFKSTKNTHLYPQFIYQKNTKKAEIPLPLFFNYQEEDAPNCLYLKIPTSPQSLIPLLRYTLPKLIEEIQLDDSVRWYFLIYHSESHELRLRFTNLSKPNQIQQFLIDAFQKIDGQEPPTFHQYYPEYQKYSQSGLPISEKLFQLESDFILYGPSKMGMDLSFNHLDFKAEIMSEIWTQLLINSPWVKDIHMLLKHQIKNFDPADMKHIRKHFDIKIKKFKIPDCLEPYNQLYSSHPSIHNKPKFEILFKNHFHMMANRFFLLNAADYEDICKYLTYRKLGKRLFGKSE